MKITHLSYADDLLLLCHGDITSLSILKSTLDHFCSMSGIDINLSKSNVFFSGTHPYTQSQITSLFSIGLSTLTVKYLGVLLIFTNLKAQHCSILIEKITNRITYWSARSLWSTSAHKSSLGFNTNLLVKPFHPPKEMKTSGAKVTWEMVCKPKKEGGLGIPNLELTNKADILRYIWTYKPMRATGCGSLGVTQTSLSQGTYGPSRFLSLALGVGRRFYSSGILQG
ncbi:uncharacterized protein LOC132277702 [Cornus florida]|uniref:uncharacterized protein LOC132277702 n=1 Tax=Cornus florida TaxID=4283 RepID=UPI00289E3376|nr:uncharacterized protein LOC132277702 [Cornus florida]